MRRGKIKMIYFSLDVETTGLDKDRCSILSLGIIAQKLGGEEVARKHWLVNHPDGFHGEAYACALNYKILKVLSRLTWDNETHELLPIGDTSNKLWDEMGNPPIINAKEVIGHLTKFIRQHRGSKYSVLAGKNVASFDIPFLKKLKNGQELNLITSYMSLDPAILYMTADDHHVPSLGECLERAGLPSEVSHDALGDAEQVRDLIELHFAEKGTWDATGIPS